MVAVVFFALFAAALVLVPALFCGASASFVFAATPEAPLSDVQSLLNQATNILRSRGIPVEQRRAQLRGLAEQHLDLDGMARSALGARWEGLSDSQQSEYAQLFAAFMEDAYLNRIQGYLDLRFRFVGQTMNGPNHARVETYVVQTNGESTRVNFDLELKGGEWKVYDVEINSISIISNYRAQFNRVINDRGFDVLMSDLRRKQKELAGLLGQPQESRQ
jgi:phospholipid transport system substrate-binding protein